VTIYGTLDAGLQNYDNGSTSLTRAANGIISTSLFGLRGSEDLGGGLRANFNLEGAINTADGRVGPGQSTSGSMTAGGTNKIFNREAWVGLSGGFGEVRIGTQDVTRAQDVDVDVSQAALLGLAPRWNATTDQLGEDQEGVIKYLSPNFSGFQFQIGYTSGNTNANTTDSKAEQQGVSFAYNSGLCVSLAALTRPRAHPVLSIVT
jgi:predicted porin